MTREINTIGAFAEQYHFADDNIREAALLALEDVLGTYPGWGKPARIIAGKFLRSVSALTPSLLSLASLKEAIRKQNDYTRLHHIAYRFLVFAESSYIAPDKIYYDDVMPKLAFGNGVYRKLFSDDVKSFEYIARCPYYNRGFYVILRTDHLFLLPIFRDYIVHCKWTYPGKPTQEQFDHLITFLADSIPTDMIPEGMNQGMFFSLIDKAKAQEDTFLIHEIVRFFRYGIYHKGFSFDNGPLKPFLLSRPQTITFFTQYYVSREKVALYPGYSTTPRARLLLINTDNKHLRDAIISFIEKGPFCADVLKSVNRTFIDSFGEMESTIGTDKMPFGENTLFQQVNYYRNLYKDNTKYLNYAITAIKSFYLHVDKITNGVFFKNAYTLTYSLLISQCFLRYCSEGFSFRRYSPYEIIDSNIKTVFIISNGHIANKEYLPEDYVAIDLSRINSQFYRGLAWRYTTSNLKHLCNKQFRVNVFRFLEDLFNLKDSPQYSTPALNVFTLWDAMLIMENYKAEYKKENSINSIVTSIRSFMRWAEASKSMEVDPTAYKVIHKVSTGNIPTNTRTLTDEETEILFRFFNEKSKTSESGARWFIILNLSLLTPLRIRDICKMRISELNYSEELCSYMIITGVKGTHGDKHPFVLGEQATKLIRKAMDIHDDTIKSCAQTSLYDYLFICKNKNHYNVASVDNFRDYLAYACAECGIDTIQPSNLRATYMTQAYIFSNEEGREEDYSLPILTHHRRRTTTLEHYVNHSDALSDLTEYLKRENDWSKTIYPDEKKALKIVIDQIQQMMDSSNDPKERTVLEQQLVQVKRQLKNME